MNKTKIELLGIWYYLGLGFLDKITKEEGKSLAELAEIERDQNVLAFSKYMYYSRAYACERLGLSVDFTQNDIHDYIDENGGVWGQLFQDFIIAYNKAMFKDVPADEEDKKKVTKAKK
jgi:hypothetical protein